jgi:hypothetical protein
VDVLEQVQRLQRTAVESVHIVFLQLDQRRAGEIVEQGIQCFGFVLIRQRFADLG